MPTKRQKARKNAAKTARNRGKGRIVLAEPLGDWHSQEFRIFANARDYIRRNLRHRRIGLYARRQRVQGFARPDSIRRFSRVNHSFWEVPAREPAMTFRALYDTYLTEASFPTPIGTVTGWSVRWRSIR
jgi:hypothetical protein